MNPDRLFKHFEQMSEAPDAVARLRRFYLEYYDWVVPKKSQIASGHSQDTLPEPSAHIAQMPSAKLATAFPLKKRLMEWADAALQSKSRDEDDES